MLHPSAAFVLLMSWSLTIFSACSDEPRESENQTRSPRDKDGKNQESESKEEDRKNADQHSISNTYMGELKVSGGLPDSISNSTSLTLQFSDQNHEEILYLITDDLKKCLKASAFKKIKDKPQSIKINLSDKADGALFACLQPSKKVVDMTVIAWTKDTQKPTLDIEVEGGKAGADYVFKAISNETTETIWFTETDTRFNGFIGNEVVFDPESDGDFTIRAEALDLAGNKTTKTFSVKVDRVPPSIDLNPSILLGAKSLLSSEESISWTAQIPSSIEGYKEINWSTENTRVKIKDSTVSSPQVEIDWSLRSQGTQSFVLKAVAEDQFGNTSSKTSTVVYNFWEPELTGTFETVGPNSDRVFSFKPNQVSDYIQSYTWVVTPGEEVLINAASSPVPLVTFPADGTYKVTAMVTTTFGDQYQYSFDVVSDATPPQLVDFSLNFSSNILAKDALTDRLEYSSDHGWKTTLKTTEPLDSNGYIEIYEKSKFEECYELNDEESYVPRGCNHDIAESYRLFRINSQSGSGRWHSDEPNVRKGVEVWTNQIVVDGSEYWQMMQFDPSKEYLAVVCAIMSQNNGQQPVCHDSAGNYMKPYFKPFQIQNQIGIQSETISNVIPMEDAGKNGFSTMGDGSYVANAELQTLLVEAANSVEVGLISKYRSGTRDRQEIAWIPSMESPESFKTFQAAHWYAVLAKNENDEPVLFTITGTSSAPSTFNENYTLKYYPASVFSQADGTDLDSLGVAVLIGTFTWNQWNDNLDGFEPESGTEGYLQILKARRTELSSETLSLSTDVKMHRLPNYMHTFYGYVYHESVFSADPRDLYFLKTLHGARNEPGSAPYGWSRTYLETFDEKNMDPTFFPEKSFYSIPRLIDGKVTFYSMVYVDDGEVMPFIKIMKHTYR